MTVCIVIEIERQETLKTNMFINAKLTETTLKLI